MRTITCFVIAAFFIPISAKSQQKPVEGLACFENLGAPEFPRAALQAHVDGTVWTTMQVSPQGEVGKIDTQVVSAWADGPKLLVPPVEKAIRAARIKSECVGTNVRVVFRYQLNGEATAKPTVTSRTEPPYLLWIESQPASAAQASSHQAVRGE